jgi:broad specificity phosphatase PhoE
LRKLILIKHASPRIEPGVPPDRWALSDEGRARCPLLAEAVRPYVPTAVVCSIEPKADETGRLVAARLGVPVSTAPGLQEHDRSGVPHLPGREFISMMELMFRRTGERVLGAESADEAADRFEHSLEALLGAGASTAGGAGGNLAVVSHGTVIALLLSRHGGGRGFQLWREMGLPSFAVVTVPGYRLETMVAKVGT